MQITDVRVRKVTKEGKLKAVVSITMDDEFVVHDIKVIEGEKGLFIAMPSKKAVDGEYRDIAHPINSGTRERIQLFEGTVIAKKNGGISETFTVRRISYGCGVEKVFPIHSPNVVKVDIIRYGKVRRAKLYYLRDKIGKDSKVKEKK